MDKFQKTLKPTFTFSTIFSNTECNRSLSILGSSRRWCIVAFIVHYFWPWTIARRQWRQLLWPFVVAFLMISHRRLTFHNRMMVPMMVTVTQCENLIRLSFREKSNQTYLCTSICLIIDFCWSNTEVSSS